MDIRTLPANGALKLEQSKNKEISYKKNDWRIQKMEENPKKPTKYEEIEKVINGVMPDKSIQPCRAEGFKQGAYFVLGYVKRDLEDLELAHKDTQETK